MFLDQKIWEAPLHAVIEDPACSKGLFLQSYSLGVMAILCLGSLDPAMSGLNSAGTV
jgi:hypothetical protein